MSTFSESITVAANPSQVWRVLADIGSIDQWNPGVKESRTTSSASTGLGAQRYCGLGGRNYLRESVVEFNEDRAITMRIESTNLPFESADIRFTLQPVELGTLVTVSPDYSLKFGALGKLMDKTMVGRKYRAGMAGLLRGLKAHVERGARGSSG